MTPPDASARPIVLYTTRICPYCVAAKRLLGGLGLPFDEVDLTADPELRQRLSDATGWRTVPMVFVEGRLVGGYDDLQTLVRSGGLAHLKPA
jgi:glutaredoxin 3